MANGSLGSGDWMELKSKQVDIRSDTFYPDYVVSRYKPFLEGVNMLKKYGITSVIDIGTSSGHFPYLCLKNGILAKGLDISVTDECNDVFLEDFGVKVVFYGDFNGLASLCRAESPPDSESVTTSFNLTHIFTEDAYLYLLKLTSNMTRYAMFHTAHNQYDKLQKYASFDFAKVIDHYDMPDCLYGRTMMVLVEFTRVQSIEPQRRFVRNGMCILSI